jgi:AAA domain, putative AbiEii toxin, Type IV TA system
MSQATLNINQQVLQPIHIKITGGGTHTYKSIGEVEWDNIPSFAVLTGLNGSGKTQLLELLAYKLTGTWHPEHGQLREMQLEITGDTFGSDSVAYLPSRWELTGAVQLGIAEMQQSKEQLYGELQEREVRHDMRRKAKRARIEKLLGLDRLEEITPQAFAKRLPDDFAFMLDEADVTAGLGHVFLAYRLRFAEELERGTNRSAANAKLGPAPWDVVNEAFKAAEFPYRVVSPLGSGILDTYELLLENPQSGQRLRPLDLSSGEKMLLGLVLWLYNSQHHSRFPRLFLLDEPDAHLHPSMTRHFLRVIKEVLVDRYGVRTILTTHSPSTVALAPEGSLFEMSKMPPRVKRSRSRAETVGLLTSGLVIVSSNTRYVLVEDGADVDFCGAVRDVLTDYGPSRDKRAIKPEPSLVFLPASRGAGKTKVGGGSTVVVQWVEKFDQDPLNEIVRGIIDRDGGNLPSKRVLVLDRYSIENYLLDPFVVYAILLEENAAPSVAGVAITPGDEHLIKDLNESQLHAVLEQIRAVIEPTLPNCQPADVALRVVSFTNGKTVQYPAWMLDRRGHDLLPLYQGLFGGPGVISPPRLEKAWRRVRLVPSNLADIMEALQA